MTVTGAEVAALGLGLTVLTNIGVVVWGASKASSGLASLKDGVLEFKTETKEAINGLRNAMIDLQGAIAHLDRRITVVETKTDTHKELIFNHLRRGEEES
jgi:Sec-independent protein translocase protein TatA